MACDTRRVANQTPVQRKKQIADVLDRLNKALTVGEVGIVIDRMTGAVAFKGAAFLQDNSISDTCAYRKLLASGSSAFRMALVKAEALAGRKPNENAIAAGVHSHDGGKTWGSH